MPNLGITKDKEIIVHCRTGREASHVYFTLKYVLGFPNVRLYRGSWVEWSADPNLPSKPEWILKYSGLRRYGPKMDETDFYINEVSQDIDSQKFLFKLFLT